MMEVNGMKRFSVICLSIALMLGSAVAFGQGQQGTLQGVTRLADGSPLPGVLGSIESPSLQGKRTASSGANGDYIFKFVPAGDYTVTFELSGMKKVVQNATLTLGGSTRIDA